MVCPRRAAQRPSLLRAGAYVEYEGKLEASEREALLPKLQAADRPSTHRRFPEGSRKLREASRVGGDG